MASFLGGDQYGARLADELGVIMEGTANHTAYEAKGRANMLSEWGAHSTQRAKFGGGSTMFGGSMQAYQTPSMLGMVKASQTVPPKYSNREGKAIPSTVETSAHPSTPSESKVDVKEPRRLSKCDTKEPNLTVKSTLSAAFAKYKEEIGT
ncbi:hypothetical protein CTI12_AA147880 [Artemisia annua]|uniref:VWA-Hint protein Vwaint domain-containing protein n=1 Tax=Artemisia annua TaxID=35608 RepID=A0A2U1PIG1_ARTAN|nr:hypothetical protein CTI12_AA147880 [Artemisia annua]